MIIVILLYGESVFLSIGINFWLILKVIIFLVFFVSCLVNDFIFGLILIIFVV